MVSTEKEWFPLKGLVSTKWNGSHYKERLPLRELVFTKSSAFH